MMNRDWKCKPGKSFPPLSCVWSVFYHSSRRETRALPLSLLSFLPSLGPWPVMALHTFTEVLSSWVEPLWNILLDTPRGVCPWWFYPNPVAALFHATSSCNSNQRSLCLQPGSSFILAAPSCACCATCGPGTWTPTYF